MQKIENTLECIDELMSKMKNNDISRLSYKCEDFELKLETNDCSRGAVSVYQQTPYGTPANTTENVQKDENIVLAPQGNIVKAPIIGTYYSSASPKDEPFVKVGQEVHKGDVLFIVESMKIMNEVKSEFDGTVITINVKDGEAIEYDQPVMIIS